MPIDRERSSAADSRRPALVRWRFRAAILLTLLVGADVGYAQAPATRIEARSCVDTAGAARPVAALPRLSWHDGPVPWATWPVRLGAKAVPVHLIVARIDPARVSLSLELLRRDDAIAPWTIRQAPAQAVLAVNAGQFTDEGPWGWVVHRGREWQTPGRGALGAALIVDTAGVVRIIPADSIGSWRDDAARRRTLVEAVQSYPQIVQRGRLPAALCRRDAVNREHRDIRLAVGVRATGEVIIALTRYAPPAMIPSAAERLPIGPTTFEMAELMIRLGSVDALLLDGGLSAQLRVGTGGRTREWPGLRAVPLAIVGTLRWQP